MAHVYIWSRGININEELIHHGFGEPCEENFLSKVKFARFGRKRCWSVLNVDLFLCKNETWFEFTFRTIVGSVKIARNSLTTAIWQQLMLKPMNIIRSTMPSRWKHCKVKCAIVRFNCLAQRAHWNRTCIRFWPKIRKAPSPSIHIQWIMCCWRHCNRWAICVNFESAWKRAKIYKWIHSLQK